jgi:replicative DNA helicase
MQDSNLLILAARPGVGKTAFALNIARHVAVEQKLPVCFFSLEMSKEELVDRLLVRQGLIDAWKLKTGQLSENDFASLSEAMGVLAEAPLYIDDTPGLTVTELRTKARRLQADKDIKFIIVDYLQLMHGNARDNRVLEVSQISQGLKNLARELRVPILAAAQLSRAMETRGGKPRLSDLRESGSIEQDADVVMFLHREDEEARESVTCSVEKHRNGPTGYSNLYFNGKQVSFFDTDKKR